MAGRVLLHFSTIRSIEIICVLFRRDDGSPDARTPSNNQSSAGKNWELRLEVSFTMRQKVQKWCKFTGAQNRFDTGLSNPLKTARRKTQQSSIAAPTL